MAEERNSSEGRSGVGPGVTGASGDLIEGTGGEAGIGGTGERDDAAASGARPDERHNPGPQQLGNASPDAAEGATRPSGSQSGMIGGGGPDTTSSEEGDRGRPGGGELQDVPGGIRHVTPANDLDESGDRAHGKGGA